MQNHNTSSKISEDKVTSKMVNFKPHQEQLLEEDLHTVRRIIEKEKENASATLSSGMLYTTVLLFVGSTLSHDVHAASKVAILIGLGIIILGLILGNLSYIWVYSRRNTDLEIEEILGHYYNCRKKTEVDEQMDRLSELNEYQLYRHKLETVMLGSSTAEEGKMANAMLRICLDIGIGVFAVGLGLSYYGK
jgi:hypothetical protein